ncbi:hypothetical protein HDU84_004703 [Entophlyctis sp. JEL0112]|nr:hypothetical protein HDU84_004703 [Entophlyctis sp. JEL0112]
MLFVSAYACACVWASLVVAASSSSSSSLAAVASASPSAASNSSSSACISDIRLVNTSLSDCGVDPLKHACPSEQCNLCVCTRVLQYVADGCVSDDDDVVSIVNAVDDACAQRYPTLLSSASTATSQAPQSSPSSSSSSLALAATAASPTPVATTRIPTQSQSATASAVSYWSDYSDDCSGVQNNLIVCTARTQFSICYDNNAVGNVSCPSGTVCCGHGVPSCVFETDSLCTAPSIVVLPLTALPSGISVPGNHSVILNYQGTGTQNYICNGTNYNLQSVTAALFGEGPDFDGTISVVYNFNDAGQPVWTSLADKSSFVGNPIKKVPAVDPLNDIPNVLLERANGTVSSAGELQAANYLVRLNTHGGVAPTSCAVVGDVVNVDYYAEYYFFN